MRRFEYMLATFAVLLVLIACLASCRFGGAKIGADVPIYGNASIEIEEGELKLPDIEDIVPEPAPEDGEGTEVESSELRVPSPLTTHNSHLSFLARNEAVAPTEHEHRIVCRHCPGLTLVAIHMESPPAEREVRCHPLIYPSVA